MEVTIHIPNEEYKELTDRQRTGLAELMQLESARVMAGEEPENKPKRQKKAKVEEEPKAEEPKAEEDPKDESTPAPDEPSAPPEPEEPPVPEEPQTPPGPELSINDIARAGAAYITKHPTEIPKMQEIFKQFGIEKITDLKNIPDKVPAFVEAVRALGVEI